jgi:hypothetical protein
MLFLPPSAGASLCATEDGRRLYLFGGHDGAGPVGDVRYLEVDRMAWSEIAPAGPAPEPREGHAAAVVGGKYLLVAGGCGGGVVAASAAVGRSAAGAAAAAEGGAAGRGGGGGGGGGAAPRLLTDCHVLDLFTGPRWEVLDDGAGHTNPMWLKPVGCWLGWRRRGPRLIRKGWRRGS